jgi:hypothetical protein
LVVDWNQNVLVHGAGPVDGIPTVMSSTRTELFGIASPNEFLHYFMTFYNIESKSKCIKCVDNRAAISRVNKMQKKYSARTRYSNDVDILTVIVDRLKSSTLRHRIRWVRSHQDDKRPYNELDVWGRLNCDADRIADKFRQLIDNGTVKPVKEGFFIPSMEVGITIDGAKVTSHIQHQMRVQIQGKKQKAYLKQQNKWDEATMNSIDWRGFKAGFFLWGH